jgi:hypothetical protein
MIKSYQYNSETKEAVFSLGTYREKVVLKNVEFEQFQSLTQFMDGLEQAARIEERQQFSDICLSISNTLKQ